MRDCETRGCRKDCGWLDCSCLQSWLFTLAWIVMATSFAWIAWHGIVRTDVVIHRYEVSDVPPDPPCCDGCCGKDCKCEHCNCASLVSEPCEDESPCSCNKSCVCGCQTHGCCACPREKVIEVFIDLDNPKAVPPEQCPPEEHGQPAPEVKKPPKKPKQADECPKG